MFRFKINFKKETKADFVIIDSIFPQKNPFAFRNIEINQYFKKIRNFTCFTMYLMKPDKNAWFSHGYGMTEQTFNENLEGYLHIYPENKRKIHLLKSNQNYKFKLAYSFFLAETYTLLPFFELNKIPFVFVLYPGGAFGLNFKKSDEMLKKIFNSKFFRGVIVTQPITMDYLLLKKLCPKDKIHFIYGGFVQFNKKEVLKKKYYLKDKDTFDIGFTAMKYSPKGRDKGYDIFIEVAKVLCLTTDKIMFHVTGNFSPGDIDISPIKERIKFYGVRDAIFLKNLYSKMDILLSPNRPFQLYKGCFDGFPMGADAMFCGVAGFMTDELKVNRYYKDKKNIILIPLNKRHIVTEILYFYHHLDKLYKLSAEGQILTQKLLDINHQINKRISVFKKFTDLNII